jgi:hypothetical protein
LSEGNLGTVTNLITLQSDNTLAVRSTPLLVLKGSITKAGVLQGVFAHPEMNQMQVKYFGVALPDHNQAFGYFLGTNQSGSVKLEP